LARELCSRGHAVRGTTRSPERIPTIEAAGAEAILGDPDRVGTIAPALAQVGVVCVLLGSARGTHQALTALHSTRLEMLLTRVIDTTVRGFVYEAVGTVEETVLAEGAELVRSLCERSRIPFALLEGDRGSGDEWAAGAAAAVEGVLAGSR